MTTLLLANGELVDGTGATPRHAHVLVEDGRIAAVVPGEQPTPRAEQVIDVAGRVVAPGFIDMHSHVDWLLPLADNPERLACMVEQGVTTVVAGNCGISPAPVAPEQRGRLEALSGMLMDVPLDFGWRDMDGFLGRLETSGPLVNVAELVGHGSLRYATGGPPRGDMAPDDLARCLDEARRALDDGACGLSFGLGYDPGMYSSLDEIAAFCRIAAERDKPVTVHLKAYSRVSPTYPLSYLKPHNLRALDEMLQIARRTGARLQVSHFIFVGRRSWSTVDDALERVHRAREEGVDVMIDAFPYTAGNTTIHAPLPYWFLASLPQAYDQLLSRARLKLEMELGYRAVGFVYRDFQVMEIGVPEWSELDGLTIEQIARRWGVSSADAMLRIAKTSGGAALMLFHTYSGEPGREEPLDTVLADDLCLFETDAIVRQVGWPNPAALGTFPRILGDQVRRRRRLSLAEAVRRMTGASAARFGLRERGVIAAGKAADLVVFDPETVDDTPPRDGRPAGRPQGIDRVFINGTEVVRDGARLPGVRPGRVLRA